MLHHRAYPFVAPAFVAPVARAVVVLLGAALSQAGCRNACQDICVRLADYAAECGHSVPESEIDACIEQEASAPDKSICREFGDAETIRNEWTCDDLAVYWGTDTETATE